MSHHQTSRIPSRQRILGLNFFNGTPEQAVHEGVTHARLVMAPSGTCFARLRTDVTYRRAVTEADLVLPDSGFMVLLWKLVRRQHLTRISGVTYTQRLLKQPSLRQSGETFWVLPNAQAQEHAIKWLRENGFPVSRENFYVAPFYGAEVEDDQLVAAINNRAPRPHHIIIGLAGGVQEKLGLFLRDRLNSKATIHCVGGALGILTGYQRPIPRWADRLYLGWLLRLLADPRRFGPRLWNARSLPAMILRYGERLPPVAPKSEVGNQQSETSDQKSE